MFDVDVEISVMSKKDQPKYCYLDIDIGNYRKKLATAAAFVDATDTRYGFSSKDLVSMKYHQMKNDNMIL